MKILLQSQNKFDEIAILDLDRDTISLVSKRDYPDSLSIAKKGYFSLQNGVSICFFRHLGRLFVRVDQQTVEFQDNDEVMLESLPSGHQLFSVRRNQETIFSWDYICPHVSPPISAFQIVEPLISDEDFDIFVLIHNVINDKNRMKRIFLQKN